MMQLKFSFEVECRLSLAHNRLRLGDVVVFENRQPVTAAKSINKSSLFILLFGIIRRLDLKPISEQKFEPIFDAPTYCQTEGWWQCVFNNFVI